MTRVMWKNLIGHRRRFVGTFLAAMLGVAFLSGTLVLGDTLRQNFDSLFAEANSGIDVVVRSTSNIEAGRGPDSSKQRGLVDIALVQRLQHVSGVAAAVPKIEGYGQLIGSNGKAVGGNGPPRIAANWITDSALNPYRLASGRAPRTPNEVVINQRAANAGHLKVGDHTIVQTPEPVPVTIVGISTFGTAPGAGGVTYTAFTLQGAEQHVLAQPGRASQVLVRAVPGVSQATAVKSVRAVLPRGVEAVSGAQYTQAVTKDITGGFLVVLRLFLVVFAGIAMLVAGFSIHNTFSILVAQRTRESALLRAIGASRRSVLTSVVVEALAVGVLASAVGFVAGLGVAGLLKAVFDGFGFALPANGLVILPLSVSIAMITGVVVTVVAAIAPAVQASRVAPMAALRDVAVDNAGSSRARRITAILLLGGGSAAALTAAVRGRGATLAGAGAVLVLIGAVVAGPLMARFATKVLGAPAARWRGITGSLARENAMRNPRRTASTASALLVGVSIVTLFTVFAASLRAQIDHTVSKSFAGDLVVSSPSFGEGTLSPRLADTVGALPDVAHAAGVGRALAKVGGDATQVTVADPRELAAVLRLKVVDGSVATLGRGEIAVSKSRADSHHWHVGSPVTVSFTDGPPIAAHVGAIYDTRDVINGVLVPRSMYAPHAVQPVDATVFISLRNGVSITQGKAAIERAVAPFGAPAVQDRKAYINSVAQGASLFLGIVYVMLALAILIALMGIANTLSLAVHERTREVGLLRAVGETRRQVRSMIRWESVIIAVFGTATGVGVGVLIAWTLVRSAGSGGFTTFAAPPMQLLIVLALGAIVGVLAAVRPARRAAKLDVMTALAT